MPATRADLFASLDELGIAHRTVDHAPIFTVEEGAAFKKSLPGGHSKNLFLKDKKGRLYLVVALGETQVDLVALGKAIRARGRLSFGKPDLMVEVLGVTPGSVTPFALINDIDKRIEKVVLDQGLFRHDPVWFHPLENNASTAISPAGLEAFIKDCGHAPERMDLTAPDPLD